MSFLNTFLSKVWQSIAFKSKSRFGAKKSKMVDPSLCCRRNLAWQRCRLRTRCHIRYVTGVEALRRCLENCPLLAISFQFQPPHPPAPSPPEEEKGRRKSHDRTRRISWFFLTAFERLFRTRPVGFHLWPLRMRLGKLSQDPFGLLTMCKDVVWIAFELRAHAAATSQPLRDHQTQSGSGFG